MVFHSVVGFWYVKYEEGKNFSLLFDCLEEQQADLKEILSVFIRNSHCLQEVKGKY